MLITLGRPFGDDAQQGLMALRQGLLIRAGDVQEGRMVRANPFWAAGAPWVGRLRRAATARPSPVESVDRPLDALMQAPVPTRSIEARWPVALTIGVALVLARALPDRIRLVPGLALYLPVMAVLASMLAVRCTGGVRRWLRVERAMVLLLCVIMTIATLGGLAGLIRAIVSNSNAIDGVYLLTSSIVLWVGNVLIFSLLYWQIDLGGPEARLHHRVTHPDWLFPQVGLPQEMVPGWHPTFVDYLFLAFTTATAFSPTDTLPLTARAKLLMMAESAISLVNLAAVAARAINILGS